MLFEVGPEPLRQIVSQALQAGVVHRRLAFGQIVHEQVADRATLQHVAVDQFGGLDAAPDYTYLAEEIVRRTPIDEVRLVNSGTEATMTAIRLARGFTGRDVVVKFAGCYHGHVDSLLAEAGPLLLAEPEAIENPFFLLYPDWALIPMVGLATAATVHTTALGRPKSVPAAHSPAARAAAAAARAAAIVPDRWSPLTSTATRVAYPAARTATTVTYTNDRLASRDLEQLMAAQGHSKAQHERQPGKALRMNRQ